MAHKTKTLTIKLVDFDKPDADKFSAVLDLAEFGLQPAWVVVNTDTANIYLLLATIKTHDYKGLPPERCLFYGAGIPATNTTNGVLVDADRIPSLQSLIQIFNRIAAQNTEWVNDFQAISSDEMTLPEQIAGPTTQPNKSSTEKQPKSKPQQGGVASQASSLAFAFPANALGMMARSEEITQSKTKFIPISSDQTKANQLNLPFKQQQNTVASQTSSLAFAFPATLLDEMALSEEMSQTKKQPIAAATAKQPKTNQPDVELNARKEAINKEISQMQAAFTDFSLDEMPLSEEMVQFKKQPTLVAKTSSAKKSKANETETPFNPQQGILKHLLAETAHPISFMLKGKSDCRPIYVYPEKKVFYCQSPLEELAPYFVIDKNLVKATVTVTELNKTIKKLSLSPQPLSYLIWCAAFSLSKGRMMLGHSSEDYFYLKKVPYRGDNVDYLPFAIYLLDNIASLEIAAMETGLDFAQAIDFYNACYLVGLIQRTTETGLTIELAHEYFTTDYIDDLIAKTMDFELNKKPLKPEKQAEKKDKKQGFMGKFIDRLKN